MKTDLERLAQLINDLEDVHTTIEERNQKTLAALKLIYNALTVPGVKPGA